MSWGGSTWGKSGTTSSSTAGAAGGWGGGKWGAGATGSTGGATTAASTGAAATTTATTVTTTAAAPAAAPLVPGSWSARVDAVKKMRDRGEHVSMPMYGGFAWHPQDDDVPELRQAGTTGAGQMTRQKWQKENMLAQMVELDVLTLRTRYSNESPTMRVVLLSKVRPELAPILTPPVWQWRVGSETRMEFLLPPDGYGLEGDPYAPEDRRYVRTLAIGLAGLKKRAQELNERHRQSVVDLKKKVEEVKLQIQKMRMLHERAKHLKEEEMKLTRRVVHVVGLLDRTLLAVLRRDAPLTREEAALRHRLEAMQEQLTEHAEFQARLEDLYAVRQSESDRARAFLSTVRSLEENPTFVHLVTRHLARHQDAIDAMKESVSRSKRHLRFMEEKLSELRSRRRAPTVAWGVGAGVV